MSLLRKTPTCPIHACELVLSHHGKKSNLGHFYIEVVGAPLFYCPRCLEQGQDTSVEVEAAASTAFLKGLAQLLDRSRFPGLLNKPRVRVDFNPARTSLERVASSDITQHQGASADTRSPEEPDDADTSRLEGIEPVEPRHTLSQLILDQDTLERIREATNVMVSQDLIYSTWGLSAVARTGRRVALNFYGPPGTGKTLAADAIADLLAKKILRISYAELESKYVGETPKNIKAAFAKARETGALLFFDEADSILGKRLVEISQSADNSINVARSTTLIELDNFEGTVIFASNLVRNYDNAFLRRMLAHIQFKLPAAPQRAAIWRCHVPSQLPLAADVDFDLLARDSDGAAGGDIQNAILLAASYAALRSGAEQVVTLADLQRAITFLLDGKRRILAGGDEELEPARDRVCATPRISTGAA
ncbi:AAA family ATPase [Thiocapsa imhoffii]|uniref:AAA family ATPase n=1 Tax=Thiocapsa imhoffii TaxID=382777 RepID=A0A9X0WKA5_9GAMM|nr:ATP-binding protein [Thiocapsa imhoffii]MBK1645924.1 AAA family ATPase [Thiocapsa imhoffii]